MKNEYSPWELLIMSIVMVLLFFTIFAVKNEVMKIQEFKSSNHTESIDELLK
jgi:hypothetical protein